MKLPIPVRVPTRFCVASSVTQSHIDEGFVTLGEGDGFEDDPQLQPYRIDTPVCGIELHDPKSLLMADQIFANLTLGALCGQGDPMSRSSTRLVINEQLRARIIVACSRMKISRHSRPSPEQAWDLAQMMKVQTQWGEAAFELVLSRLLRFIDRNVSLATLPNAFQLSNGRFYWRIHTRGWNFETSLQSIGDDWSDGRRSYTAPKTTQGIKWIVEETVRNARLAGKFDISTSLRTHKTENTARQLTERSIGASYSSAAASSQSDLAGTRIEHQPLNMLELRPEPPLSTTSKQLAEKVRQLVDESIKTYRHRMEEDIDSVRLLLGDITTIVEKQIDICNEEFLRMQKRETAQKLTIDKIMLLLNK